MKVLITGGAGFIGRAVNDALVHDVSTFDRDDGDIRNRGDVWHAAEGMDVVIHLAGVLGTHELFDTIHEAIDINIKGTVNVLDACVEHGAAYVGITMPQVFPSIYTATKVAATRIASAYALTHGLRVAHVRAFNAYGPGQAHGKGHPQKIIPTFATNAWLKKPLPIWGTGEQSVDLIHTHGLAKIIAGAAYYTSDALFINDLTFDGGSGRSMTVNEVAREVCKIAGVNTMIEYLPMRRGEVPTEICATRECWQFLPAEFVPTADDLKLDLRETVESYKPW